MACEIIKVEGDLVTVRIGGVMRLKEQQAVQRAAADIIGTRGKVRALVLAENFQGWSREDDWSDVGFLMEYGDAMAKLAIVGEERWKDDAFAFAGKGFRETEIEFFPTAALAEAELWVRS
ncbi:STAS/SEC14 domain-containing protein [Methylomagnum sp.]